MAFAMTPSTRDKAYFEHVRFADAAAGSGSFSDEAQEMAKTRKVTFLLHSASGKTLMIIFRFIVASWLLASSLAFAADTSPASPRDTELEKAKTAIARKDWAGAQAVLDTYTATNPRSADGFNLLGYSLRNQKKYDDSLVAYKKALTLDPKHKGAHEYIGIAYIQMGQLDKAKEHLASLDKICTFSCEEYRDLKKAIAQAQ
jgi:tetratricopeptide (TPR) repeat protein